MTSAEGAKDINLPPLEGILHPQAAVASLNLLIPALRPTPERQRAFLMDVLTHSPYKTKDQAASLHPDVGIATLDLVQYIPQDYRKEVFTRVLHSASPYWKNTWGADLKDKYNGWHEGVCTAALRNIKYLKLDDRKGMMEEIIEKTRHKSRHNGDLISAAIREVFPQLGLQPDQLEYLTREYLNRAGTPVPPSVATYGGGV